MASNTKYITLFILLITFFVQFSNFVSTEEVSSEDPSISNFVSTEEVSSEDPSKWPGHLEPLGSQNIKHSVTSADEFPKPEEFFHDFVVPGKPLLIKNGAKISPAFQRWTDDYFVSIPGAENSTVFVEQRKKENRTFPGMEISFKKFIETYNDSDIYMVNGVPDILQ